MRVVYPGSFDPVTTGHFDIIERGAAMFDELVVVVAPNEDKKKPLFSVPERVEMLTAVCAHLENVSVDFFDGLLVSYANKKQATAILRSLRAVSDFEFEFQMALMNRRLDPSVETIFLMTGAEHSYLSSSIVKEIAALGGSVTGLVPALVEDHLQQKLQGRG
jgi:pantetheine-phosphate adenylyltransferase